MNSKLQFERHLQFTAVILFQQSHGFVVLIIPCYHAGTIKETNVNTRTRRLRTVLFKYFINALSMHSSMLSSMHNQCIVQCNINAFFNASSMHSSLHLSMHPQCTINTSSMHSLHQIHQFRSFSSSFHHQCIVSAFINASPMYSSMYSSMHHQCNPSMHRQCIFNASIMHHQRFVNALSMHSSTHHHALSLHLSCIHQCIHQCI